MLINNSTAFIRFQAFSGHFYISKKTLTFQGVYPIIVIRKMNGILDEGLEYGLIVNFLTFRGLIWYKTQREHGGFQCVFIKNL